MILSDKDIELSVQRDELVIDPWNPDNLQPASVDLTLGKQFILFKESKWFSADSAYAVNPLKKQEKEIVTTLVPGSTMEIYPKQFMLAATLESVTIPDNVVGILNGKSSLARLGLIIHTTAGFIDPGFQGTLTLELLNVSQRRIILTPGMLIGQISFTMMTSPARVPYGDPKLKSKYQGQKEPTASQAQNAVVQEIA